jgi:hypothetical protein
VGEVAVAIGAIDVKALHAKIGELTLENDFLAPRANLWVVQQPF